MHENVCEIKILPCASNELRNSLNNFVHTISYRRSFNNLEAESSSGVGKRDRGRSDGQVVSARLESILIGDESKGELLALRGDPVDGSLLGVAGVVAIVLAVSVLAGVSWELFLGIGFFASGVVRLGIAANAQEFVVSTNLFDFIIESYLQAPLPSKLRTSD